jgi:Tol biopolymer transport system component
MSEMEELLKDRLADLAREAPTHLSVPPNLVSRSHRRSAMVLSVGALVTAVIAVGSFTGVRALIRAEGPVQPAVPDTGVDLGSSGPARITVVASGHTVVDVDPETGSTRTVELPTFDRLFAWSPDGSRLLFSEAGRLDVLEPDGSITTVETTGPADPSEGSWSPDGTRIVYMTDAGEKGYPLRVVNADGSGLATEFGSETTNGRFPAWSPDGSTIAFLGGAFDSPELWFIGADGSDPHMVVGCDPSVVCPTWSPPVWSPDGSAIAFLGGTPDSPELWFIGADGSDPHMVIGCDPSVVCPVWSAPTWSPDGSHVAFAASGANGDEIYVVGPDGSHLTRLSDVAGFAATPSWSPDGTRIAFTDFEGSNTTLEVMDADGSSERDLGVEVTSGLVAWSSVVWHAERSA